MTLSRNQLLGAGLAAAVLTAVALAAANFAAAGEQGGGIEYAGTLAFSLTVGLALFGWVIPRSGRPARAGLIIGLLALLSLAAFWSGLPYVLGPAAIVLGLQGRSKPASRTSGTIAAGLGAVATVAAVAALAIEQTL